MRAEKLERRDSGGGLTRRSAREPAGGPPQRSFREPDSGPPPRGIPGPNRGPPPRSFQSLAWGSLLHLKGAPLLLFFAFLLPGPAQAQLTLLEGQNSSLELGGYLRSLTGFFDLGFDLPEVDRTAGFNAEVVRLKWTARFGENTILEVHDRLLSQISSSGAGFGTSAVGFGVSVVPGRSLDLSTSLIEKERIQLWHDIDRLSLTVYSDIGDLTLGRQAITWGISNLFPVADLWAQFSPFELDTEEKPGIDAARLLSYPGDGVELDLVAADRGASKDWSAGLRASFSLSWTDLYLAGGKFWDEAMVLGGFSAPVGSWKLRAEGVFPYNLGDDGLDSPRLTAGVDWMGGSTMISGEYHFNGIGTGDPSGYGETIQDPRFARGESYYLGRHYLGGLLSWSPGNDRLALVLSALTNLQDPSATFTPIVSYDIGQSTRASAGAMVSVGDTPRVGSTVDMRSEYGSYGDLFFTRISIYF